jgi:hypothetical protein
LIVRQSPAGMTLLSPIGFASPALCARPAESHPPAAVAMTPLTIARVNFIVVVRLNGSVGR